MVIKKLILILFIILLIYKIGLYQSSIININDISISKPFGYRYSSLFNDPDIIGLNTKFNLSEKNFSLFIIFEQNIFNERIIISFKKMSNIEKKYLKKSINDNGKICSKIKITDTNNNYSFIYKFDLRIDVVSNAEKDLRYFYNEICNKNKEIKGSVATYKFHQQ